MTQGDTWEIRLLGPMELRWAGEEVELPRSRKARALLAYLALTGREHTRAQLGDLFFADTDDPRGGLRWCLSKLRSGLPDGASDPIVAGRTHVAIATDQVAVDVRRVAERVRPGCDELGLPELEGLLASFRGELLEGLDLPELHAVQAFYVAERGEARRFQLELRSVLAERLADLPERALEHLRMLVHLEPHVVAHRVRLLSALLSAGRRREAEEQYRIGLRDLQARQLPTDALRQAFAEAGVQAERAARALVEAPAAPAVIARPPATGEAPFVGRSRELEALALALDGAVGGAGAVRTVAGDAGVGKSRLLRELSRQAHVRGVPVLTGRCEAAAGVTPYLPFADAFDAAAAALPATALSRERPLLSTVLPSLSPGGVVTPGPAGVDRYAVFRAMSALLGELAAPQGLLVVLEDMHWADRQSALLFDHLAQRLGEQRVLLVASYRDVEVVGDHPLADTLAALRRLPAHERLKLGPLDDEAARALLCAAVELPEQTVEALAQHTGRNPLYIEEMLAHLREEGRLSSPSRTSPLDLSALRALGLPEGIRDVIGRRLSRLSEGCVELLTAAAALSGAATWPLLVEATGGDAVQAMDRLEEALVARVLVERDASGGGVYDFSHGLIRQALYESLSVPRRAHLHDHLAGCVERVFAGQLDGHLAELVHHRHRALPFGDLDAFVECTLRAGQRATDQLAFEAAHAHYARAIEVLEARGIDKRPERGAQLHTLAGVSLLTLNRWPEARADFEAALSLLPEGHDVERVQLLLHLSLAQFWTLDTEGMEATAPRALALAEEVGEPNLIAAATGFLGKAATARGEVALGRQRYLKAQAIATDPRDAYVSRSLQHYPINLHWVGRFAEAAEIGLELADAARAVADGSMLMNVLPVTAMALGCAGQYRRSWQLFEEARRYGEDHRIHGMLARMEAMTAGQLLDLGDPETSGELAAQAHERAGRMDFLPPFVSSRLDIMLACIERGELAEAERQSGLVAEDLVRAGGWHGWVWQMRLALGRARLSLAAGRLDDALEMASETIARAEGSGRVKHLVGGLRVRAAVHRARGRTAAAIADLRRALLALEPVEYPALFVGAAADLLPLDGDDILLQRATAAVDAIAGELDASDLRVRFESASAVATIRALA